MPGHAREGRHDVAVDGLLEHAPEHLLHPAVNVLGGDEARLDIHLRELGLAVGAQILIAEAARNLEIAFQARHHEQLLVLLGALGQRVELAGAHTAGHQIVAGTLGRGFGKDGGLELQKTLLVEVVAHGLGDAVAQHHVALHSRAAQVEEAVLEADILVGVAAVELERQHRRAVEHLHLVHLHLDFARGEVGVGGIDLLGLETADHAPLHLNDGLHTQRLRLLGQLRRNLGVEHHLRFARTVAQINKNHPAVVADGIHPADQRHVLVNVRQAEFIAVMSAVTVHNHIF